MSSQCVIRFDNSPAGVYYAGQTISGTIELTTTRPKTIRSMHVRVNGFAEVRWNENVSKTNQEGKTETVSEAFTSIEEYFSSHTYVHGQSGGGSINLSPGRYVYPFQAAIPPHGPTSMNGLYGHIRYEVVFTIDRPLRYHNIFKQPFTVISPLDLNLNHSYAIPAEKTDEKEFCCAMCCGGNEPILVKANLPFTGYAPGQKINFQVSIDNKSSTDCPDIKVKLIRNARFTCRTPQNKNRFDQLKVVEKRLGPVTKESKKDFEDSINIPSTAPSTLETCSIIHVEYTLHIIVKVAGLHTNVDMPIPITIGTVPLLASITPASNPITSQPGGQTLYGMQASIAPSTFEEDFNKTNMLHKNNPQDKSGENVKYLPKYPIFYNPTIGSNNQPGNVQAYLHTGPSPPYGQPMPNQMPPPYGSPIPAAQLPPAGQYIPGEQIPPGGQLPPGGQFSTTGGAVPPYPTSPVPTTYPKPNEVNPSSQIGWKT